MIEERRTHVLNDFITRVARVEEAGEHGGGEAVLLHDLDVAHVGARAELRVELGNADVGGKAVAALTLAVVGADAAENNVGSLKGESERERG